MDSNNRKSYLESGKKWLALSKSIFGGRAITFVSFQDDKKTVMRNFEALEV